MRGAPWGERGTLAPPWPSKVRRTGTGKEAQRGVYIGVDWHCRTQCVCWMDTVDGEIHEQALDHGCDDGRAFYAPFATPAVVGVESSSYSLWFHRLVEEAGHPLLVGAAYAIRQLARRRQKNDRRDAPLLLDLQWRKEFPAVHRPCAASREEDLGPFYRRLRARRKAHAVVIVAAARQLVLRLDRLLREEYG